MNDGKRSYGTASKQQFSLASLLLLLLFTAVFSLLLVQNQRIRSLESRIAHFSAESDSVAQLKNLLMVLKTRELEQQRYFARNHPQLQKTRQEIGAVERVLVDKIARDPGKLGTKP